MKTSELILKLQKLVDEHGDLEVIKTYQDEFGDEDFWSIFDAGIYTRSTSINPDNKYIFVG